VNAVGESPPSNEASATPATIPTAPINLVATSGDSYVNITWNVPSSDGGSPITNYEIYRGSSPGGETFLIEVGNVLHYNDTSVAIDVTYYYKVSAVNILGKSPLSDEVNATPALPINQLPTCTISALSFGATVSGTTEISGTASDSDGTIQKVEIRIDDSDWVQVSGTTSWTHQWDTTTVSNDQHRIYAKSYDGVNYSSEASIGVMVYNTPPPPEEKPIFEELWLWVLIVLIVIVAFSIVVLLFRKRGGREPVSKAIGSEGTELEEEKT